MSGKEPADEQRGLFTGPALREAYGDWLAGVEWHSFGTFTFRHPRSVRRAGELFRAFLEAGTAGCGEYFTLSVGVWGSEPHKSGNGHVHALLRWHPWCGPRAEAFAMSAEWRMRYGRVEMSRYDPTRGAAYYLTKYVLKDAAGSGEWDVWTEGDGDGGTDHLGERCALGAAGDGREDQDGAPWKSRREVEDDLDREEEEARWWKEVFDECDRQDEVRAGRRGEVRPER